VVALQPDEIGRFRVSAASDNTFLVLGSSPEDLFSLESFSELFASQEQPEVSRRLEGVLDLELGPGPAVTDVFLSSISTASESYESFWCSVHKDRCNHKIIICEFEPASTTRVEPSSSIGLKRHTRLFNYQASPEELKNSTTRKSRPLYATRNIRGGPPAGNAVDLVGALNEIQSQLISQTSLPLLFNTIVGTISELTGFDRVMVYRFDECKCGAVVSEYVNSLVSEDLFIGLHFPSSDLPQKTRELYTVDRVQILRNRTSHKASLVHRNSEEAPIRDLTGSYLRDAAPHQVQFLSDLDVCSALTISLIVVNDLWGLITCHSYGSRAVEISPPLRDVCRSIGDFVSSQVERKLIN